MKIKLGLLFLSGGIGALLTELLNLMILEIFQFIAIVAVVLLDALLGISRALINKEFETRKAFKGIFMMVAFTSLLATVLIIEKGYPFASFLSETVLLPIIVFQVISILKNMQLLGLISGTLLDKIIDNIDKHKNGKHNTIT
ncbi:phage holin family protein [Nonlabens sp.]|jgi:toxin secretion/phage lysis holin|uniref:phage holin family protein n=1 Tax=Nonlabens sp. TaxID=1888209 RepID=UPI0039E6C9BF